MSDLLDEYREKAKGTNIDQRSLLSNDYFNHFNSIIMLLGLLPDMPDMLEEIDAWKPMTYVEHFQQSGLDFGPLAVECYEHAPPKLREKLERMAEDLGTLIDISRLGLRRLLEIGDKARFAEMSRRVARDMQDMVDTGGAIIHGYEESLDQSSIDALFP